MMNKTRNLLKEMIEFHEACGRNRRKTTNHFAKVKKLSRDTIRRLLGRYLKQGISILETKIKPRLKFRSSTVPIAKKVIELLKEDPSISNNEGAQIVGVSQTCFGNLKKDLLTPGRLTTEKKIQLGLISPPAPPTPEVEAGGNLSSSDVSIKVEESNAEDVGIHFGDDYALSDFPFENDCKTEPEPTHKAHKSKRTRTLRHCLFCFIRLDSENKTGKKMTRSRIQRGNPSIPMTNDEDSDGKLGENLNVIFALKNVFDLESSDLIKCMKVSKGKDPRGWYHLCSDCDGIMKEAVAIQRQVLQLTRELENCKSRIREKVKQSCEKGTVDVNDDLLVTKLIRESVCPRATMKKKVRKSVSREVEVKTEPVDVDDCEPAGDQETFLNNYIENGFVTDTPTGEVVADTAAGHSNPSLMETELSTIIGIYPSGASIKDLKIKPKLVICELCGEEMRTFSLPVHTLRIHDILMEGYTEYKCPESGCQYKTVTKMHLKTHMDHVHLPLKQGRKHSCHFCGKKFKCNSHLKTHLKTHTNAESKPYQCEICGRGFAVYGSLWSHVKGVHQGWVSPFRRRLMARNKKNTATVIDSEAVSKHPQENYVPPVQEMSTTSQHEQQQQQNNLESECNTTNFLSILQHPKTISSFTSL